MKKLLHISSFLLIANCQLAFSQSPDWLWAKSAEGIYNDFGKGISTDANGNVFVTGYFEGDSLTFGSTTLINTNAGFKDIFIVKYDPSGNVLWAKSAGGNSDEWGYSISTDASGNVLVTGYFQSFSITFDSTTLTNSSGWDSGISWDSDIFIVKYDPSGNVLWAKSAEGTSSDYGQSISTDANGNVLVTGSFFSSSLTFGSTTLTNAGSFDIFIVKYDPSGNVLWAKSGDGIYGDGGYGISTDANGNVLITGFFGSPSITFGSTTLTNASSTGKDDLFIVKYDPNGNVLWAKSAGGINEDRGNSISTDANGNVFLTGYFYSSSITFGSTTLTNAGSYDIFIVKYDPSGNALWAKSAGGTNNDYGQSISTDASGNVLVTGYFNNSSITFGSTTLTKAGGCDIFVAKLDGVIGIEEENNGEQISVYPNPNSGKINVQMSKFENVQMKIYNMLGECIYATADVQIHALSNFQVDLSNQPKGIYLIKFNSEKGTTTKKIIVQ